MRRVVAVLGVVGGLVACSDDEGDLEAFCATAASFVADNPLVAVPGEEVAEPASTSRALETGGVRLGNWADDAPPAVRDDVELLASTSRRLAEAFDDSTLTSSDRYVAVDAEAAEEASAAVLSFVREECGVDLDPGPP